MKSLNLALVSNNEVVVVEILLTIRGLALMLDLMKVLIRHFAYSNQMFVLSCDQFTNFIRMCRIVTPLVVEGTLR